ncbi:MAG TPA: LCP family protein [Pilimelia sp.]|nr:LCP family protein [Pilimelia sp.]
MANRRMANLKGLAKGLATDGRRLRWVLAVVAAIAVLAGTVAVARAVQGRYDVPSADLFGSATPTPGAGGSDRPPSPTPSPTPEPGAGITGPLNILLVGIDPRVSVPTWRPNADAVLILHVPATMDRAYLFSLPRDLRVDIPAFPPARFGGARTKLTHAMSYGSRVPGTSRPSTAQGFQLLARTVSRYTGIARFDAGAVLNFGGFTKLVDAVGGVDLYVDQRVVSRHRQPDGQHRRPVSGGYTGPQMVYQPGTRHLTGWQALDYARQRYLTGGDYTRQRHQQQLVKALAGEILDRGLATDPARLDAVLRAVGGALTFDGRGRRVIDYAYALRGVRPAAMTLVALPGASVGRGGGYLGEELKPVGREFLAAVRANRVPAFMASHPELVVRR